MKEDFTLAAIRQRAELAASIRDEQGLPFPEADIRQLLSYIEELSSLLSRAVAPGMKIDEWARILVEANELLDELARKENTP